MAHFADLYDDVLMEIFQNLSLDERFRLTRVCHRFHEVIHRMPITAIRIASVRAQQITSCCFQLNSPVCSASAHHPPSQNELLYDDPKHLHKVLFQFLPQVSHKLKSLIVHCPNLCDLLVAHELKPFQKPTKQVPKKAAKEAHHAEKKRASIYKLLTAPFSHKRPPLADRDEWNNHGIFSNRSTYIGKHSSKHGWPHKPISHQHGPLFNIDSQSQIDLPSLLETFHLEHLEMHFDRMHPLKVIFTYTNFALDWLQGLLQKAGQHLLHLYIHSGAEDKACNPFSRSYPRSRPLCQPTCCRSRKSNLFNFLDSPEVDRSSSEALKSLQMISQQIKEQCSRSFESEETRRVGPTRSSKPTSIYGRNLLEELDILCPLLEFLHFEPLRERQVLESLNSVNLPPNLRVAQLPSARLSAPEFEQMLYTEKTQNLQELCLYSMNSSLLQTLSKSSLPFLHTLKLNNIRIQTDEELLALSAFPNLRVLELCLQFRSIDSIIHRLSVALPELVEFKLEHYAVSSASIVQIVNGWPRLTRFECSQWSQDKWKVDSCISHVLSLPNLKILALPSTVWSNESASKLIQVVSTGRLHALDVSYSVNIPVDELVQASVNAAKLLESKGEHMHLALNRIAPHLNLFDGWPSNFTVLAD